VQTVIVRFHHPSRDLDQIENDIEDAGAGDALVTGYTAALSIDAASHKEAAKAARRILDTSGATRIRITKRGAKHAVR